MKFTIHPEHQRNKLLQAVRRTLQLHAPMLMNQWEGGLRFEPDLVYLDLHENNDTEAAEPDATWEAFSDRPSDIIAGWLLGQLWRHWEG